MSQENEIKDLDTILRNTTNKAGEVAQTDGSAESQNQQKVEAKDLFHKVVF